MASGLFSMAYARTVYTSKMEVYGKQPDGPFYFDKSGMNVVERLVEPIKGSNQNVTVDNWFCSIPLCEKLLTHYHRTLVEIYIFQLPSKQKPDARNYSSCK